VWRNSSAPLHDSLDALGKNGLALVVGELDGIRQRLIALTPARMNDAPP
jgi:hypothetical protein